MSQNTMFRFKMVSIFTQCMSYLYAILKKYMLVGQDIFVTFQVKCLDVSNAGFDCHLKVSFLYYQTRATLIG